jgi:hypothetical protein
LLKREKCVPMVGGVGPLEVEPLNNQNNIYSSNICDIKVIFKGRIFHPKLHLVHQIFPLNMFVAWDNNGKSFRSIKMEAQALD